MRVNAKSEVKDSDLSAEVRQQWLKPIKDDVEATPTPKKVIDETYDTLYKEQMNILIANLEEKINGADYNPSRYERYSDEKSLEELKNLKKNDFADPVAFDKYKS